ncbi:hypothetical protein J7J95_01250 [bacterium]|nr:hypothetical protein [bacterium]
MEKITKKTIFAVFFLLFFFPFPVHGQTPFSLSLSPPLVEILVKPGKGLTQAFEVQNQSPSSLYLKTEIVPFLPDPQTGQVQYLVSPLSPQPQFSLLNANIKLGQTFHLKGYQKQQLVLKITIPPSLPEGDYYYTFFVVSSPPASSLAPAQSKSLAKIGSHLLISVSSRPSWSEKVEIQKFRVFPRVSDIFQKVSFSVQLKNQGSHLTRPTGKITIYNWLGRKEKEILLRPDNILAYSSRNLVCIKKQDKQKDFPKTIPCQFSSSLPGRFKAVLEIKTSSLSLQKTVTFWFFPFTLGGGIIATFILLFIIKRLLTKRNKLS